MDQPAKHPSPIKARIFTDPSCPWGYSASPSLRTIEWRYRDQIEWQLVMVGLSEPGPQVPGLTPVRLAQTYIDLRDRFGMPFVVEAKVRNVTSSRSCQAVIAARLLQPGSEWRTLRALQILNFNSPLLLDDDEHLRVALGSVPGLNADRIVDSLDSPEVQNAYQDDRARSRAAIAAPTGTVAPTGPMLVFEYGDVLFEAPGLQPVQGYEIGIERIAPTVRRSAPAASPLEALKVYPSGLTTQETAAIVTPEHSPVDRASTERALVELLAAGKVKRLPMGNDAIWLTA